MTLFKAVLYFLSQVTWFLIRNGWELIKGLVMFAVLLVLFIVCLPFWPHTTLRLARYWWEGVKEALCLR